MDNKSKMTIQDYLTKMKKVQDSILKYIDEEGFQVINLSHLMKLLDDQNIRSNKYDLDLVLRLLLNIADNHHRGPDFYEKICKFLKKLKKEILSYFSNREIFNIFKSNKRILLFLIENEMLVIDKTITSIITELEYSSKEYPRYFYKQIKPFINLDEREEYSRNLPLNYEELQRIGENEHYICKLIREDLIDEFIVYVTENKINLKKYIEFSIFETNQLLLSYTTLIEYAAFFGSIKIVKYLHQNDLEMESSIWLYAIHGRNVELIDFLNENHVELTDDIYENAIRESIKCHHNDIFDIISNNYLKNIKDDTDYTFSNSVEFYNFSHLKCDLVSQSYFYHFCKCNYCFFVNILLKNIEIDINSLIKTKKEKYSIY